MCVLYPGHSSRGWASCQPELGHHRLVATQPHRQMCAKAVLARQAGDSTFVWDPPAVRDPKGRVGRMPATPYVSFLADSVDGIIAQACSATNSRGGRGGLAEDGSGCSRHRPELLADRHVPALLRRARRLEHASQPHLCDGVEGGPDQALPGLPQRKPGNTPRLAGIGAVRRTWERAPGFPACR